MFDVLLLAIFFITAFELGKSYGKKYVVELIKQYLDESIDFNDFLYRFSILWKNEMEE